jgi:hypothetical protein
MKKEEVQTGEAAAKLGWDKGGCIVLRAQQPTMQYSACRCTIGKAGGF